MKRNEKTNIPKNNVGMNGMVKEEMEAEDKISLSPRTRVTSQLKGLPTDTAIAQDGSGIKWRRWTLGHHSACDELLKCAYFLSTVKKKTGAAMVQ
ncbi:hypothetical protein E2C01_029706 [Portunus trituberculatus]|uniref:Uncharacterized protein n=1 Tax=Portunus trituberculatus TaxID=210409 RepID=A0A5B7EV94_PORTR|nr:hypothetical protein [Portunus trituberculatus]